jgi:hypothetical protein
MTLKNLLLTMHDDELGYEMFANIFEESSFAAVFQVGCFFAFLECKANEELATMSCYAPFFVT